MALESGIEIYKSNLNFSNIENQDPANPESSALFNHQISFTEYYFPVAMKIRILNKQPLRLYAKLGVVFGRINNPNVIIDSQEESNSIHYGGAADLQVIKPTIVDGVVFSLSSEHDLNSDYNSRVSVQFDVKGIATPEYHYGGMADSNSFNADLNVKRNAVYSLSVGYVF